LGEYVGDDATLLQMAKFTPMKAPFLRDSKSRSNRADAAVPPSSYCCAFRALIASLFHM
jgi:hypothetical protein